MFWILLIGGGILALYIWCKKKRLKVGNLILISGGVKKGKTQLSVALAYKQYRKQCAKWRRECRRARRRYLPLPEKPLLYSNMPIGKKGMSYAPVTVEHLTGQARFRYGSVVYINEVSLVSGSKDIKDEDLNDFLLQFYKLCAHFLKGGYVILDTQSPQDCHYTIKRSLSTYLFIYERLTLPFFSFLWVRNLILVDGETSIAIDTNQDPDDNVLEGGKKMYFLVVRNKWWKYYDQYAYSSLQEHLPVGSDESVITNQKVPFLLRCRDIITKLKQLKKGGQNGKNP